MTEIKIFTSRNCGPCAIYKQSLEGLPNIRYVDVDDPLNVSEAIAANVMMVPTTVLSTGEVLTGVRSRDEVMEYLAGRG